MIRINSEKKVFNLITKHTTYAMGVFKNSVLLHLYWGKRLNSDMSDIYFSELSSRAYSPFDLDEYSSDILPMEYATFGNADTRTPAMNAVYADGSRVTRLEYVGYEIHAGKPSLQGLPAMYRFISHFTYSMFDSFSTFDTASITYSHTSFLERSNVN